MESIIIAHSHERATMNKIVKIFKALANQRRLRILNILSKEKLTVVSVAERIKLSPKSTSKHLIKLEGVGFVKKECVSRYTYYLIANKKIVKHIKHFIKIL